MLVCLCEGRRRKVKVRWKNLQSKHNHQYHRVILGNFFISFHRHFNKGLPQGDALCPRLFTMCINPIAWNLKATDGYKLSKPIEGKITHLLYVDDMKVFAASKSKLDRVLKVTKTAMEDIGLIWNGKKCSIAHIKKGVLDSTNHNDRLLRVRMF